MPDGLVTSRPLQNEATGIDLHVPLYQEVRGSMMTGHVEYQIVVVTRLAAFKSAKHRPGDVVQLMVSKKYSEIDEFYSRLLGQYPTVPLPAMPRKALFVGESDIRERRAAFDELVKFIARHATLATCPELLDFLGAKTTDVADFKTTNIPDRDEEDDEGFDFFQKEETAASRVFSTPKHVPPVIPATPEEEEEQEEEEEALDPLGIMWSKKPTRRQEAGTPKPPQRTAKEPAVPNFSLFDEEEGPDEDLFGPVKHSGATGTSGVGKTSTLRLFEAPDLGGAVEVGDALLLPTAFRDSGTDLRADLGEDIDELSRVEEDLDRLLTVSRKEDGVSALEGKPAVKPKPAPASEGKPAVKPKPVPASEGKPAVKPKPVPAPEGKPAVKPKPELPTKPLSQKSAALVASPGCTAAPETMDQIDILRYIQQNEAGSSDDLELF